jgi:gas vesicle protein
MEKEELIMLLAGLGAGLLIGGALGIFFAPYAGREMRMRLLDAADDIADRVNRFREPEKYSRIKP